MKRIATKVCACACALALAASGSAMIGCSGSNSGNDGAQQGATSQQAGYTFTDDLGNQVTVSTHGRVVAGMGSFANIWELAGGTLVGASSDAFSDYHIESKAEKVGDFSSLNAESIIALNPDFVILTGASSGRGGGVAQTDLKDALQAAGIPVAYFNVTTFDDYLRMLKTCCDITGDAEAYKDNGTEVAEDIDAIKKKAEGKSAGSVAVLTTYSGGTRVQASSTQTGTMLAELGASNITDADKSLLSDYSLESLVKADPDFIFLLPMGDSSEAAQKALKDQATANPAWKELTAVKEGRVITLEYDRFYLVTCYTPNAQEGLKRIEHRMSWDDAFRAHLCSLDQKKPVIACGDLNVAHQEIDLKNPGPNRGNAGFSDQEREKFTQLLAAGFTDTFRYRNPDAVGAYSWWSYRFNARKNNAGWRIDYFLVSDRIRDAVAAAPIYHEIFGSDHCPVGLELEEEALP